MIIYKFEIDKNACFVYWAQSLIKWRWYFDEKEYHYFLNICGSLNKDEQNALNEFKRLLQRKDTGYFWLWERYSGKQILNPKDKAIWETIKNILEEKFEKTWQRELPKLLQWQKLLQNYPPENLDVIFLKIANFFDAKIDAKKSIAVKIFFYHNENSVAGHVKGEFDDLFVLNLSNLKSEYLFKAINTIAHETIHLIERSSPTSEELLKNSYLTMLRVKLSWKSPFFIFDYLSRIFKLSAKGPGWRYLFIESIISSMAGARVGNSYLNQKLFNQPCEGKEECKFFDYRQNKENYGAQIKAAASCLAKMTAEYLEAGRKMDKKYCDEVAIAWLNLRIGEK